MECEPAPINASSFADNVSTNALSFAVIVSRKLRQMRAWPVSNASRYSYGWLAFLVANLAMIGFALSIHRYGLFIQQLGFMGTSFLGIYRAGFTLSFQRFRGKRV